MIPQWFSVDPSEKNHIPYDNMWKEARIWYPEFLQGHKFILNILFKGDDVSENDSSIIHFDLTPIENIENYTDHLL